MQATREPTQRQRASRGIAALNIIATKFVMLAMVGRRARQLKVPPRDADEAVVHEQLDAGGARVGEQVAVVRLCVAEDLHDTGQ